MTFLQYVEEQCYKCGIWFMLESCYRQKLRETKNTFYCPNGHGQHFTESETDRLRRERDRLLQQLAMKDDELARQRTQLITSKAQVTKLRKRAAAGVCPCCNRTFANMAKHMKIKHPDFKTADIVPLKATS